MLHGPYAKSTWFKPNPSVTKVKSWNGGKEFSQQKKISARKTAVHI